MKLNKKNIFKILILIFVASSIYSQTRIAIMDYPDELFKINLPKKDISNPLIDSTFSWDNYYDSYVEVIIAQLKNRYHTFLMPRTHNDLNSRNLEIDLDKKGKFENLRLQFGYVNSKKGLEKTYIVLNKENYEEFYKTLNLINIKYREWIETAKENEIQAFSKVMKYEIPVELTWIESTQYHRGEKINRLRFVDQYNIIMKEKTNLTFTFQTPSMEYLNTLCSSWDKLSSLSYQSSSNKKIQPSDFNEYFPRVILVGTEPIEIEGRLSNPDHKILVFRSPEEIDLFLDLISPEKIDEYVKRKTTNDLFKD